MADKDATPLDDNQDDQDFAAGFNDAPPPETAVAPKPEPKTDPKPQTKEAVQDAPKVEAPKYVQLTQEQFDSLQTAAGKVTEVERQISKLFGTTGDMQQIVKKLQAETPKGMSIDLPADVVSEMEQDFPELAGHFRKSLEKALKGVRGTGTTESSGAGLDQSAIQNLVREIAIKHEIEALEDAHQDWRTIVGTVDAEGKHDPNNEFRQWLGKQPVEYQTKINATNSAVVVSRAIDKFLASKAKPALPKPQEPQVAVRRDRFKAAIQPRGDGGQAAPAKSADDDFAEGFATG